MSYEPHAPTGQETTAALRMAWTGLAANAVLLASYLLPLGRGISAAALGVTGALIFVLMIGNRFDDYFKGLRDVGLRWGMAVIALYLFAGAFLSLGSGAYQLGFFAASGELPEIARRLPGIFADGYLLAILAGLAFHLGFAFARIRGTSR